MISTIDSAAPSSVHIAPFILIGGESHASDKVTHGLACVPKMCAQSSTFRWGAHLYAPRLGSASEDGSDTHPQCRSTMQMSFSRCQGVQVSTHQDL